MKKLKLKASNLILLLIITSIIVTTFTLSKYKSTVATSDATHVALMADDVSFSIEPAETGCPGFSKIYPIEITNKLDGKICEVSQNYTITLKQQVEENIPLKIELYEDQECLAKIQDDNNDGIFESNKFTFEAGVENKTTIYLKVSWPEDKNSSIYSLEINYIKIDCTITQVN